VKEEKQQEEGGNEEEVVVFSAKEDKECKEDKEDKECKECNNKSEGGIVKNVVESSCNTDDVVEFATNANANTVNECKSSFFNSNCNNSNDGNNHYKGLHTEVMPTMPVLFIEEFFQEEDFKFGYKKSTKVTDWRAYVYYDSWRCVYVVNGTRRRDNEQGIGIERRFPDVCMTFKSKSSLAFYLQKSMCSLKHKLSVTMYSMYRSVIHLTTCGAMPSFHSIHNCRNKFRTELFGYDDCNFSLKEFDSYLKVLKDGAGDGFLFRPTK
jgi:hypothetical protein